MLRAATPLLRIALTLVCLLAVFSLAVRRANCEPTEQGSASKPTREQLDYFEKHIRPVLVQHCNECHSADAAPLQGGLRVDSANDLRTGGDSGPGLVPGKPDESLLLDAIRYETYEMPPDGKLPDEVIERFSRWIEMGAPDPRIKNPAGGSPNDEGSSDPVGHWAFQQPGLPDPPTVIQTDWPATSVDRFVLARLEQAELSPSPVADARTQLRRVYYDLIGLPPSAEETTAFEADPSDPAHGQAVDRLLASQHFGERWGRHWLDIARYADTKGYVFREDRNYPHAYTYRDWVIQALNEDLPYDRFVLAQLAADQIGDPSVKPAAGFLTLGRRFINNRHDIIDDRIDVVTRGLMGLTASCARCHDHKYDPITTSDYYSMYGVFASSREPKDEAAPLLMVDANRAVEPVIFIRGNPANRGDRIPRRFLDCLSDGSAKPYQNGSGRLEMARAITSPDNPLTARVWVNRVWLKLFGQGLVTTPSDFGTRCDPPSHPLLLDWLASRFVEEGWSTKWLIRTLVTSRTYRQASSDRAECCEVDPENRLLWRMPRKRLDLEALRDSLLVAAGRLDTTMGGPSVKLTQQPFPTRRSVYAFVERQNLPNFFRTFDFAGPDTHSPKRPYTTVPQQALYMMNSPFAMEQATYLAAASREEAAATEPQALASGMSLAAHSEPQALASGMSLESRSLEQGAATDQSRIRNLFRAALGRDPAADELAMAREFLLTDQADDGATSDNARNPWQYGWGHYDDSRDRVVFHPLPHFTGSVWQGGAKLPDAKLGWVSLSADGGHPGNDPQHAAIRRWITPHAGRVTIRGTLEHGSDEGDGVRGRVVSNRGGLVAEWPVHQGKNATQVQPFAVAEGEIIDLLTDCLSGPSFDSFRWSVTIRLEPDEGAPCEWTSATDFRGPGPEPLGRWERLAQALLMTNEFAFID